MDTRKLKIRIALLWVFMPVADFAHALLVTWEPGGLEKMISRMGKGGSGWLLFESLFWLVPLWLAFITTTMKDSINRWVNFVLGIIFTLLNIFHFMQCGVPLVEGGPVSEPTAHHILLVGSTVLFAVLIVWYSWKWLEKEA